jgi:hypothetical protein
MVLEFVKDGIYWNKTVLEFVKDGMGLERLHS